MAKIAKKLELVNADGASCFWVNNGPVLRNIKDLKEALAVMNEETFNYHVNKERNDFAAWVKDVLRDEALGNKLLKTKTLKSVAKAVETRLRSYE